MPITHMPREPNFRFSGDFEDNEPENDYTPLTCEWSGAETTHTMRDGTPICEACREGFAQEDKGPEYDNERDLNP